MKRFLRFTLFVLALCSLTIYFSACGGAGSNERTASADFVMQTELIAGAGQGWPETGTDIGFVKVEKDGTNLYVTLECDITGDPNTQYYMKGAHLDIGTTKAGFKNGVSFGLFPWTAETLANVTTYTFTVPIVGNYPNGGKNAYRKGAYDFSGAALSDLYITAHAAAAHLEGYEPGFTTQVIVCDGREQGELGVFPVHVGSSTNSSVAGDLTVSLVGTDLHFDFTAADANCTTIDMSALQLGTTEPIAWGNGPTTWTYQGAAGDSELVVPLSDISIPDCGLACDDSAYDLFFAYFIQVTDTCNNTTQSGSAFADFCGDSFVADQPGECHLSLVDSDQDGHLVIGLYQGPDDTPRGDVDMWVDANGMLWVKPTLTDGCDLEETQMFIGTGIPDNNAGSWNFNSGDLPVGQTSYTFGPIDLSNFGVGCGDGCEGTNLDALNFALHTTGCGESSTAWTAACRVSFGQQGGDWKSWDDCVLTFECTSDLFYRYCGFTVPECESHLEDQVTPENPGTEIGDTAMGLDAINGGDGISRNEPGWFPTMYPTVTRWGWTFRSPRP